MKVTIAIILFTIFLQSNAYAWSLGDPLLSRKEQETAKENVEKAVHDTGNTLEKAAHDTGHTLEKAAHDTGNTLEKAAHDTGHTIEKAAHDTGHTIEKAFHDTGAELERFFKRVCEDWLNIPDGDCSLCWTSEGGEDGGGEVYACEGGDPDQGTPPSQFPTDNKTPTPEELQEFDEWVKASEPSHEELEPWESGLSRFLPGKTILGTPLPDNISLVSVTESEVIREKDDYGVGFFLAPRAIRSKDGQRIGTRYHGGVDFVTTPGEKVFSPIDGKVARIPNAYKNDNHGLKAIVIQNNGYTTKVLYVKPETTIKVGEAVTAGTVIGHAQDISVKFKGNMTNHVHLTITDQQGRRVSPDNKWVIKSKKK